MKPEEWRDIPGYEGMYQVSDQGRVKSLEKTVPNKWPRVCTYHEKVLKPNRNKQGYLRIHVCKLGEKKHLSIHRLVASAFLSEYTEKKPVDHLNGICGDNRLSNIRMATQSENQANRRKGTGHSSKFKGVTWDKERETWKCVIMKGWKRVFIGRFQDEVEAAKAYDEKLFTLSGEFSLTNKDMRLLDGAP